MAKGKNNIISINAVKVQRYNAAEERAQNILGNRIAEARQSRRLSLAKFGVLLEEYGVYVGATAINKWERGDSAPNAYQLLAISDALGIEDMAFFMSNGTPDLNDEGIRKLEDYKADLIASGRYKPRPSVHKDIQYIDMPVSILVVSAGVGAFLDDGNFEMISFPITSVPDGAEFGVRVSGDSMEPVYHDGQIVWVQQCERVGVGEVGVFVYDGDGYLKVYGEQLPQEEEPFTDSYGCVHQQPVMISYNRAYEPIEVSASSLFKVIGRIL